MGDFGKSTIRVIGVEMPSVLTLILHERSEFSAILRNDFALSSHHKATTAQHDIQPLALQQQSTL